MIDQPKKRRWMTPVLIASLAVNLLVAGVVVGAYLSDDGPRKRNSEEQRAARGVMGEPFFRALPTKDRRAVMDAILAERDTVRDSRRQLRASVENVLAAIRADTFDRTAVAKLLGEQRNAAQTRQDLGERLLLDRLEQMSPAERAAYADALEKRLRGLRRR
jgi:uncharacterized membrane protein